MARMGRRGRRRMGAARCLDRRRPATGRGRPPYRVALFCYSDSPRVNVRGLSE
ncbi:hypothetical protein HanRHA438_Chr09g0397671 [Helianthus annuus]|nr:hypothetical protein HanRHA438_Chr09g0397671 [Helianthus annuus]